MSGGLFKVTIAEEDYNYTTYTAWVQATSKAQAIVIAAAMAGQEKIRREFERTGRLSDLCPNGLLNPRAVLEPIGTDEYYEHREEVTVTVTA